VSVGWTIGGGVEFAATDNITLKAEYLYADFGKASFAGPAGLAAADVTTKASIVRTGVNFKF
jgi:outer membrane immunogenic protein